MSGLQTFASPGLAPCASHTGSPLPQHFLDKSSFGGHTLGGDAVVNLTIDTKVTGSGLPAVSHHPWDATGFHLFDLATTPKAILTADTMRLRGLVVGSSVTSYDFNHTLSFAPRFMNGCNGTALTQGECVDATIMAAMPEPTSSALLGLGLSGLLLAARRRGR